MIAFENTNAVARYAATQTIVHGEPIDHMAEIAALDAVTLVEVVDVAAAWIPSSWPSVRRASYSDEF